MLIMFMTPLGPNAFFFFPIPIFYKHPEMLPNSHINPKDKLLPKTLRGKIGPRPWGKMKK